MKTNHHRQVKHIGTNDYGPFVKMAASTDS